MTRPIACQHVRRAWTWLRAASLPVVGLAALGHAQAATALADGEPRSVHTRLVLLAALGVLLLAVAVLTFAVWQLRRDAAERRRTYLYRRRGGDGPVRPPAPAD